jgi:hypothetical protein
MVSKLDTERSEAMNPDEKPLAKKAPGKLLRELLSDLIILVGIVGVAVGAGMIYEPAGYLVGGAELVALGYLLAP